MCERWVGDWTDCNILTPKPSVFSSTSFSFCWVAQSGVQRAYSPLLGAGSLYSILSLTNWLQTNWTSCRTGLYHCLTPTCFLWASHLHPIQTVPSRGYTLISSTRCTCSLINGWVEGQYVTLIRPAFELRSPYLFPITIILRALLSLSLRLSVCLSPLNDIYIYIYIYIYIWLTLDISKLQSCFSKIFNRKLKVFF